MNNIRQLRSCFSLSIRQLAELTGLSAPVISRLELEERFPKAKQIEILCDFFQVSSDYLLSRSDDGIICSTSSDTKFTINANQYKELEMYIFINSNHIRMISNEGVEKLNYRQEQKNLAGVQGLMNVWGDDLSTEIISKLVLLTDEQKQFILTTIKMWGK